MAHVTMIYAPGFMPVNPHAYAVFQQVDRDRSGSISLPELHLALCQGGEAFSIKAARLLLRLYDADRSGSLGYAEFERLLAQLAQWRGFFASHTHGSGRLQPAGLSSVVRALGYGIPDNVIFMMFSAFECVQQRGVFLMAATRHARACLHTHTSHLSRARSDNNSGTLTFDEFVCVLSELNSLTTSFRRYDPAGAGRATLDYSGFLSIVFGSRS